MADCAGLPADTADRLADLPRQRGIRHALVRLPGGHEVPYWAEAFEHTRQVLKPRFDAAKRER